MADKNKDFTKIKCKACGDIIEYASIIGFHTCKCGNVKVQLLKSTNGIDRVINIKNDDKDYEELE